MPSQKNTPLILFTILLPLVALTLALATSEVQAASPWHLTTGPSQATIAATAAATLTVTADATHIPTGDGQTVITVDARNASGQPQAGDLITFSATLGSVYPVSATTDAGGIVTATFTAATMPGRATVTATSDGAAQHVAFLVQTPQVTTVTLQANATVIQAGAQTALTVTLHDQFGHVLPGEPVSLFSSLGNVAPANGVSDSNGQVEATFTAGNVFAQANVSALSGSAASMASVKILSLTPATALYLPVVLRATP